MSSGTTLVLGASARPGRYSNLAVRRLRERGINVVAVGRRSGTIGDVTIQMGVPSGIPIDTVTMYLNERNQAEWGTTLLGLSPRRIIFNPGAENPRLALAARERGIQTLDACTLVLLSTGQYQMP